MIPLDGLHLRLLAAVSAIAPALALLLYFSGSMSWRHLRELVWIGFGLGFAAAIPIAGIAGLYAPFILAIEPVRLHALAVAFLGAAIPEEVGKFLVVFYFMLRHEDMRQPLDALVLSVMVSLGFATIENLYYVFGAENWTETAMLRAVTAVPMHATVGVVMGYFAARYATPKVTGRYWLVAMLLIPTVLHGLYDYPVFAVQQTMTVDPVHGGSKLAEFQMIFVLAITATAISAITGVRALLADPMASTPIPFPRSTHHRERPSTPPTFHAGRHG